MEDRTNDPIDEDMSDPTKCNLPFVLPKESELGESKVEVPRTTQTNIHSKESVKVSKRGRTIKP